MKRYEISINESYFEGEPVLEEDLAPRDRWVLFADHEARVAELEAKLLRIIGDGTSETAYKGDEYLDELRSEIWREKRAQEPPPTPEEIAQHRADFLDRGGVIRETPFGELWYLPGIHSFESR